VRRDLPTLAIDGTFNSPHGVTDHDGALYLAEWMVGGRVIRLKANLAA
jgi:hypothetical protein